jgi:Zn finger protein HypA/HybF involved in hydrogenase expression
VDISPLDGNATAGPLAELFAFDMTMAVTTCAHCRDARPMAELRAYVRAPGMVLRCPSCDGVQLRLVQSNERAWLDLQGIHMLQIPASAKVEAPG